MSERQDQPHLDEIRERLECSARAIEEAMKTLGDGRGAERPPAATGATAQGSPGPGDVNSGSSAEEPTEFEALVFTLGKERYAIEQSYVRRVLSEEITPLPGTGGPLVGIVLIEGTLTPIFDLGPPLGLAPTDPDEGKIVVLGRHAVEIGLLTENPRQVTNLEAKRVASVPWRLDPSIAQLVRGVWPDGTTVLDGAAILSDERFFVDARRAPAWRETAARHTEQHCA